MYLVVFVIIVITVVLFVGLRKADSKKNTTNNVTKNSTTPQTVIQQNNVQNGKRMEQQRLIDYYANSELLVQILNYICNGNYKLNKPKEIIINHDNIKSEVSGEIIVFDFIVNRVPKLESVFGLQEEVIVKPQMAIANAINKLMGNEYEIIDRAESRMREVRYPDGESALLVFYSSNYVQMRLKATKNF